MTDVLPAVRISNGEAIPLSGVPELSPEELRRSVLAEVERDGRVVALFGWPLDGGALSLAVVLAGKNGVLGVLRTRVRDRYAALTPDCPQVQAFEREIAEQWGVRAEGHPRLDPLRFHRRHAGASDAWGRGDAAPIAPAVKEFFAVEGDEVHEVAVGPVHAGIIEPGHFRFQCHGEEVLHLEIALGFQHRGVEPAVAGGPDRRTIHYMETLAGDTTAGHAWAYCQAVEALAGCEVPPRAQHLRGVALELERLANHTGDLGALAGDIGFLPTASFCGRLRGEFLNLTLLACGSRLGRGWLRPGGVAFDAEPHAAEIGRRVESAARETLRAADLLRNNSSVRARFEETGTLGADACRDLGVVGVAARASGIERDVRSEFPHGVYRERPLPTATWATGDVFGRARVRWMEIERSARWIAERLATLPTGELRRSPGPLRPDSIAVSLVEGWRGEICHVALTDAVGRFARYKVVDPSFHNWPGLAAAMRGQQISDFPLCNKSFNLSYCGHDL